MKLQYLNFTSVKRFVRRKDRRLSTNFLQALDEHCTAILDGSVRCAKDAATLTSEHVKLAVQEAK